MQVVLLFPHVFWDEDIDTFCHVAEAPADRGEAFLFYQYAGLGGGPVLAALIAG